MDAMAAALQVVASRQAATAAAATSRADGDGSSSSSPPDATLVLSADLGERPVVSPHLFGIFLEHLGRCIYGGVCE